MQGSLETEVKIRVTDLIEVCRRIESLGFQISQPRALESNTLYDTPARSLLSTGQLLRLRDCGGRFIITCKGPYQPGRHKTRPELETTVGSLDVVSDILVQLGYTPVFRYEKYRREYHAAGQQGIITVDETPIGNFLELEGPGDWIDQTAGRLGLASTDYVLQSYARLYLDDCEQRGLSPSNMVFSS